MEAGNLPLLNKLKEKAMDEDSKLTNAASTKIRLLALQELQDVSGGSVEVTHFSSMRASCMSILLDTTDSTYFKDDATVIE